MLLFLVRVHMAPYAFGDCVFRVLLGILAIQKPASDIQTYNPHIKASDLAEAQV